MLGTIIAAAAVYSVFASKSRNLSNASNDEIFELREVPSKKKWIKKEEQQFFFFFRILLFFLLVIPFLLHLHDVVIQNLRADYLHLHQLMM